MITEYQLLYINIYHIIFEIKTYETRIYISYNSDILTELLEMHY